MFRRLKGAAALNEGMQAMRLPRRYELRRFAEAFRIRRRDRVAALCVVAGCTALLAAMLWIVRPKPVAEERPECTPAICVEGYDVFLD